MMIDYIFIFTTNKNRYMINNNGIIYALIASVAWGLLYNIDQKILLKSAPLTMFLVGGIMQIIILIPYAFTDSGHRDISLILTNKNQLYSLFVAEILCIIAGLAILYAVKFLDAPTASVFEISYPIFVALFYYIFFNGNLNSNFWIGTGLIIVGSIIILR